MKKPGLKKMKNNQDAFEGCSMGSAGHLVLLLFRSGSDRNLTTVQEPDGTAGGKHEISPPISQGDKGKKGMET